MRDRGAPAGRSYDGRLNEGQGRERSSWRTGRFGKSWAEGDERPSGSGRPAGTVASRVARSAPPTPAEQVVGLLHFHYAHADLLRRPQSTAVTSARCALGLALRRAGSASTARNWPVRRRLSSARRAFAPALRRSGAHPRTGKPRRWRERPPREPEPGGLTRRAIPRPYPARAGRSPPRPRCRRTGRANLPGAQVRDRRVPVFECLADLPTGTSLSRSRSLRLPQ